jgi:tripartite-type tricarboxylate transporter receptor subunit TctC
VTLVAAVPNMLVVHPGVPAKSVKELVELAKTKHGQLSFASAGTGSSQHLAGEKFKSMAKIDIVHGPYKGSGPAITDLIGVARVESRAHLLRDLRLRAHWSLGR